MVLLHDIIQVTIDANLYLAPEWILLLQIAECLVGRRIAIEIDLLGRSKSVRDQSFGKKGPGRGISPIRAQQGIHCLSVPINGAIEVM